MEKKSEEVVDMEEKVKKTSKQRVKIKNGEQR